MTEHDLVLGATYYRLTYADPDWTMPGVEPMVYIGKNIFGDAGAEEQFYFQDTVSVVLSGLATSEHCDGDARLFPISLSELGESLLTLRGVITQVKAALSRSTSLGNPMLSKQSRK